MAEQGSKKSTIKKLLITVGLVTVLVLGAAAAVWYLWQQDTDQLNQEISRLKGQIQTLGQDSQAETDPQAQTVVNQADYTYTSAKGVEIEVYKPQSTAEVTSPVEVVGQVPGNWSFEANFPVELQNSQGQVVAKAPAQLQGDWMTQDLVVFTAELSFSQAPSGEGKLILRKANPSGSAENEDKVTIPVKFE